VRLSIRGKLFALVVLLTLPMAVAIGFLIERGIGKDIRFAEKERIGLDYQRPLFEVGIALRRLEVLAAIGAPELELARAAVQVDDAFSSALRADARDAEPLRLTAAALEAEARDVPPLPAQQAAWFTISAAIARREAPDVGAIDAVATDARRLALLAGDNSNLILDPDLDSYYLMDLTNLAIPDAIVRIARARSLPADWFTDPDALRALGTLAALLDEVDLPRIASSTKSALAEDERFYGVSESLAPRMQPALDAHDGAARRLVESLRAASREPLAGFGVEALALEALTASHALWTASAEELDRLLEHRIEVHRDARIAGLLLALAGFVVAALGGRLVARTIARSLDRARALAERVAQGDLASTSEVTTAPTRDETGALIESLSRMAGSLRRLVAQVAASAAAVTELSARVDETSSELGQRARRQRDAAVDAAVVTQEFAQSIESGSGHANGLLEAAEATCTSMQEIESQARAIEAEMEHFAQIVAQLLSAMDQMASNGQTIAAAAQSLRGAGDEVVGSVVELRGSIASIETSASTSRDDARAMLESVEQGEAATRESMAANAAILEAFEGLSSAVAQLQQRSARIEQVLAVIDGVADEVQLLSLNASIISAQAGEHGRAFTVVALEIGELARTTEASSGEIRKSVRDLQHEISGVSASVATGTSQVQNGLACAEAAQATLGALSERARASAQRATTISEAAALQSVSVAAVERAASTVQGGVIEIGASVEQYSASVRSVRDTVASVDQLVKPVLSAAARQTGESGTVSTSMRELMERAKELGASTAHQRDATARIRAALDVFRDGTEATTSVAGDLDEVVALLRERMASLAREVTRFQI
jgi:methyl-accepting chemotaxis protein